jgi:hypothetical protein
VNGAVGSCGWGVDGQTGNSPLATKTQSLEAGQQPTRCTTQNASQWLAFPNRYMYSTLKVDEIVWAYTTVVSLKSSRFRSY